MAAELMELRFGNEYDRDKLWFRFEVGTLHIKAITGDSQFSDEEREMSLEDVQRLLKWITFVEASMHGERD